MVDPTNVVRQGYDLVSYTYRSDDAKMERNHTRWLTGFLESLRPRDHVLDLGCGCGVPLTRLLSEHYNVTGVDLSPVQIKRARGLVPDAEFICADMCELNLQPGHFGGIIALYSIIHVPETRQQRLLRQIASWLRPGGTFVAILGATAWTGTEANWLGVEGATMYWSHRDEATYRSWLKEAGFEIQHEEFVGDRRGGSRVQEAVHGHQFFHGTRAQ